MRVDAVLIWAHNLVEDKFYLEGCLDIAMSVFDSAGINEETIH